MSQVGSTYIHMVCHIVIITAASVPLEALCNSTDYASPQAERLSLVVHEDISSFDILPHMRSILAYPMFVITKSVLPEVGRQGLGKFRARKWLVTAGPYLRNNKL